MVEARIGLSQSAIEDLERSGLEPRDVAARIVTASEVAATGDHSSRVPDGYVIPYFDFHGDVSPYYRIKILDTHSGIKYRAIKDMPNHIYFPPDLQRVLKRRQNQYIIITEGEKKSACAVKRGFPCIGLSGIDNWRNRQITLPKDTQLKSIKSGGGSIIQARIPSGDSNALVVQDSGVVAVGFHDLLDYMVQEEMEAIIIFDSDKGGVKSQVQRAAAQLGYELRYRGLPIMNVRQLVLPSTKDTKVGLDDFLVSNGTKEFASLLRICRRKRMAFPRHPNPKTFVASRLQKARLSRKETQDVSLAILMELETRGRRLRNKATQEMFFFNDATHTLMDVALGNPRIMLHDTAFGSYLYREFNLAAADQRVVAWLAAQFHGEPGVEEAVTHRVLARPESMANCIAYQLSDAHFIIITPKPDKPYIICANGEHGVLFEQGHVEPLSHRTIESLLEEKLESDEVLWKGVLSEFNFMHNIPNVPSTDSKEQLLEEGRMLAILLYYLSPWFLRWNGTQLPVELVVGEPGSGKSSLYALRQTVITGVPRLTNATNDIKDWYAGITSHGGLYVLDNIHFTANSKDYQQRLSDELCRIITEPNPHVELRKLYTTSDVLSMPVNTTFAITAIEQPFYTPDLIQRSATFELQVIEGGHDAQWVPKQIAKGPGRAGWVAHHLATIHQFLKRAIHDKEWDDDFRAGHRLANYEQALILMAKVLDMPHAWIPGALKRQTAVKLTETDWTMAGLEEFVQDFKLEHPKDHDMKRFGMSDISAWADAHETYGKNRVLVNAWALAKYVRTHKGTLQSNLGMQENGSKANKRMYSVV